ncbi:hypothetical protein [Hydrogenothermus marinus]|uniref:Uncharacterized protein n=1 Tax=Hydrogenothermus marinus TaxID=133270 RepID=A0A3M0BMS0_9AQUI|nr:hypothetical protein [Hydrogenothermus marinus]RMA96118.1 hypothetical protein CLV39_1130 [Hydrogenothermus marinus]
MKKSEIYIDFLIGDLEYFLFSNKTKINSYVLENHIPTYKESLEILDKFSTGLKKTSQLIKYLDEIEDTERLRNIFILSSESLAWILFTFPSVAEKIPVFLEEFDIKGENILDMIGQNLIQIEMFIDNPKSSKYISKDLKENINNISMTIGHITQMIKKGSLEN